jgi:hypothetical protein
MKGDSNIADILQKEYNIVDLTPWEEIDYEIQHFTDEISRVKITSKSDRSFCCPVYAMFDGYNMSWYGNYGFWGFNCTWKTNVMNLAYNSPYYQLEKLESREHTEFNEEYCAKNLLKAVKEGNWYEYDLDKEQQTRFEEYISTEFDYIYSDDVLSEHEETCELIKELMDSSHCESDWNYRVSRLDFERDDLYSIFDCEQYELYQMGQKEPVRFFIILYMLSVVNNLEEERLKNEIQKKSL